jgi:hypothetical protein
MKQIRLLLCTILTLGCAFSKPVVAGNGIEPLRGQLLWPCGVSLLPCRSHSEMTSAPLPYWRGQLADRPVRASHIPVFPTRQSR